MHWCTSDAQMAYFRGNLVLAVDSQNCAVSTVSGRHSSARSSRSAPQSLARIWLNVVWNAYPHVHRMHLREKRVSLPGCRQLPTIARQPQAFKLCPSSSLAEVNGAGVELIYSAQHTMQVCMYSYSCVLFRLTKLIDSTSRHRQRVTACCDIHAAEDSFCVALRQSSPCSAAISGPGLFDV